MRKLITAVAAVTVLTAGALFFVTGAAQAAWEWCWGDPVIEVNGKRANIEVGFPLENLPSLAGPVHVQINVPKNVDARVVEVFSDYFEEQVVLTKSTATWDGSGRIPVQVRVRVNATESFPVQVKVSAKGLKMTVDGASGSWIDASFELK
jgi:hypothetical protein